MALRGWGRAELCKALIILRDKETLQKTAIDALSIEAKENIKSVNKWQIKLPFELKCAKLWVVMILPERRASQLYKPNLKDLIGTEHYLKDLFARSSELDLMRGTDLAIAIRNDQEAILAGNPTYQGPIDHVNAALRYVEERLFKNTQFTFEPDELLSLVGSELTEAIRRAWDRRSFLILMGGVGVAAATSALAIFVTSQPRIGRTAVQPKPGDEPVDKWVQDRISFARKHIEDTSFHLGIFAPFIVNPNYQVTQLSWLQPALTQRELTPMLTREQMMYLRVSDPISLLEQSGRYRVDLQGIHPKPKIYLLNQSGEELVTIDYNVKNPEKRVFEIVYFANRAGEPITEKAAAAELIAKGEWTREEVEALVEGMHPKEGRKNIRRDYTRYTDPKIPYDWAYVTSTADYQFLDPNKPQPLKGYYGSTIASTFVRTRGSVTIRAEFDFTT